MINSIVNFTLLAGYYFLVGTWFATDQKNQQLREQLETLKREAAEDAEEAENQLDVATEDYKELNEELEEAKAQLEEFRARCEQLTRENKAYSEDMTTMIACVIAATAVFVAIYVGILASSPLVCREIV